jgi:3-methyl-2-oxobutanoate hydroxymethyltransferase
MLGLFSDFKPTFAKRYAELGGQMREAFSAYGEEVRRGAFPGPEHGFCIDEAIIEKLY